MAGDDQPAAGRWTLSQRIAPTFATAALRSQGARAPVSLM